MSVCRHYAEACKYVELTGILLSLDWVDKLDIVTDLPDLLPEHVLGQIFRQSSEYQCLDGVWVGRTGCTSHTGR